MGAIAGYAGGAVDAVLMRLVDAALSIPRLLLLIGVVALWHDISIAALTLLLAGTGWFAVSRLTRAETLVVRERDFVVAARMLGASPWRILLAPRAAERGGAGCSSRPPWPSPTSSCWKRGSRTSASASARRRRRWGGIIQDGAERVGDLWWITLFPGLAILITVFACNVLGDALRDALDPRQLPPPLGDDIPHQRR